MTTVFVRVRSRIRASEQRGRTSRRAAASGGVCVSSGVKWSEVEWSAGGAPLEGQQLFALLVARLELRDDALHLLEVLAAVRDLPPQLLVLRLDLLARHLCTAGRTPHRYSAHHHSPALAPHCTLLCTNWNTDKPHPPGHMLNVINYEHLYFFSHQCE